MSLTETVEIETGSNTSGSVIWLHGLGADGHDFEPIVPELRLPDSLALRFVFPHAPMRPVTINGGMAMRAWYDIFSLDRDGPVDEDGIRQSGAILDGLIRREQERGIDARRIVVAGFSQGGAIAMHSALRFPERLAGLMALSTYLPLRSHFAAEVLDNDAARNKDLPIFMAHGSFDPVLPMQMGRSSADLLIESDFNVEWHDYPMAHAVCAEEIEAIRQWLVRLFSDAE
jgi:phospholipase/carboxylesterase